jgi:hypothetical protein
MKYFQELSKLHKNLIVFAFIAILVLGVIAYYFKDLFTENSIKTSEVNESMKTTNESVVDISEKSTELDLKGFDNLGKLISNYHDFYNETLGWENDSSINEEKQLERAEALINGLDDFGSQDHVDKKDIKNAEQLATIYIDTEETDALLYLHRIFHDLDKAVNRYKHKDSFGATYTYGKKGLFGNQLDNIKDYIKKNIE